MVEYTDKKAILVVSFGTSYSETRRKTIDVIEQVIKDNFFDYEVRRAFTSKIIVRKLIERDGLRIDNVAQAFQRLKEDGYQRVVVQPTYMMSGFEYDDMIQALEPFYPYFEKVICGKPLLNSEEDLIEMADILAEEAQAKLHKETGFVFMGHGTRHGANQVYARLDQCLKDRGHDNCMIGTVESAPDLEDVTAKLERNHIRRVVITPLMIVAGDHAARDMAGEGENSWKNRLEAEGYQVTCVFKGLGENKMIQNMFVKHTQMAIDLLEAKF